MLSDNISIGDRIEISLENDQDKTNTYFSCVENTIQNDKVTIRVPINYGKELFLDKNVEYSMLFFTEKGMILFKAVVESYIKQDDFNLMIVRLLNKGEKVQRRKFFRYTCLLPLKFKIMYEDKDLVFSKYKENNNSYGVVKDLSGGGVRFLSNENMAENTIIKSNIGLEEEKLTLTGEIINKSILSNSDYKYQYRAVFKGLKPEDQDKIVQFIFAEQKRLIEKLN